MIELYTKLAKEQYPDFPFGNYDLEVMTVLLEEIDYDKMEEMREGGESFEDVYDVPTSKINLPRGYMGLIFKHNDRIDSQTFLMIKVPD